MIRDDCVQLGSSEVLLGRCDHEHATVAGTSVSIFQLNCELLAQCRDEISDDFHRVQTTVGIVDVDATRRKIDKTPSQV